ncbi:MAG: carboxymuconolactone decarboxylase family protein, partial [Pseudomonadota bacterium]
LAEAAGRVPNLSTDEHFEALKQHYSNEEITAIVGIIAMFGFLNRWNDTLSTLLEPHPRAFAEELLAKSGWEVGDHG